MRKSFFFFLVLLFAAAGLGAGAMAAQKAKPAASTPVVAMDKHAAKGVACQNCHANVKKPEPVAMDKCLTCHGDGKAVAKRTASTKPTNPHESRHYGTEADCNSCHHQHKPSESLCADCHPSFKFKVP
jgi:RecJ-like exonuclease